MFIVVMMLSGGIAAGARQAIKQMPITTSERVQPVRLTVKFHDSVNMRVDKDHQLPTPFSDYRLWSIENDLRFQPLISLSQAALDHFEERAARLSGREQPDLGGMMSVSFGHSSALNVVDAAKVIEKWPIVEYVNIEHLAPPPPGDLPPTTPDFTLHQDWQGPGYGLNIEPF